MDFSVKFVAGQDVFELLKNEIFISSWTQLAHEDTKGTVIQEPPFVVTWYNQYKNQYDPILCLGYSSDADLVGILPLAKRLQNGCLVHAGADQAEYHGWICHPDINEEFPIACLIEIKRRFSPKTWGWSWLPPKSPLGWLTSPSLVKESIYVKRRDQNSLLWDLRDEAKFKNLIKNKSIKNEINRYKKQGNFHIERIKDKDKTRELIRILGIQYDFRQALAHGVMPFTSDVNKANFYIERQNYPEAIHFTMLWVNNKPLAFNFGACDNKTVYLGVTGFDPLESKNAPGTLLLLKLAELLKEEGYRYIDLTPGADKYKERFGNASQQLVQPTFYFNKRNKIAADFRSKFRSVTKRVVALIGFNQEKVRQISSKIGYVYNRVRGVTVSKLFKRLPRLMYEKHTYFYYRLKYDETRIQSKTDTGINVQQYEDLLKYEGPVPKQEFLSEALKRLLSEETVYTVDRNGILANYMWMTRGGKVHHFTRVDMTFMSPKNSVILYDAYTQPEFRRQGLYKKTVAQMISDGFRLGASEIYAGADPNNVASRHTFEKLGFTHFRTYTNERFLFWKRKNEF